MYKSPTTISKNISIIAWRHVEQNRVVNDKKFFIHEIFMQVEGNYDVLRKQTTAGYRVW
jgi:hypothetical protein